MDEIIMRRLRHLQWLEENHAKAQQAEEGARVNTESEEISNVLSADWNRKQRHRAGSSSGKTLPNGWRKEHWKTQQSMALDYAGVTADCKEDAVRALEAYEACGTDDTLPPAA